MKKVNWVGAIPISCDFCYNPIIDSFVDGKHKRHGIWAIFCRYCHKKEGIGLGIGKGQLYIRTPNTNIFKKQEVPNEK